MPISSSSSSVVRVLRRRLVPLPDPAPPRARFRLWLSLRSRSAARASSSAMASFCDKVTRPRLEGSCIVASQSRHRIAKQGKCRLPLLTFRVDRDSTLFFEGRRVTVSALCALTSMVSSSSSVRSQGDPCRPGVNETLRGERAACMFSLRSLRARLGGFRLLNSRGPADCVFSLDCTSAASSSSSACRSSGMGDSISVSSSAFAAEA